MKIIEGLSVSIIGENMEEVECFVYLEKHVKAVGTM